MGPVPHGLLARGVVVVEAGGVGVEQLPPLVVIRLLSATQHRQTLDINDVTQHHQILDINAVTQQHQTLGINSATQHRQILDINAVTQHHQTLDINAATQHHQTPDINAVIQNTIRHLTLMLTSDASQCLSWGDCEDSKFPRERTIPRERTN